MTEMTLLYLLTALLVLSVALLLGLFLRRPEAALARLRVEMEEALRQEQRDGRLELRTQLDGFARQLVDLSTRTDSRLDQLRDSLTEDARKSRDEGNQNQAKLGEVLSQRLLELRQQLDSFGRQQDARIQAFGEQLTALRASLTEDARSTRTETVQAQQRLSESLGQRLNELVQRNEQRIGEMRATLEQQLRALQEDNAAKLEKMRETVDEKLQSTLNQRLDSSFKLVSERLEQVQRGLGEMQQLATGVGDLKRVLSNVKTRGSWGEVQLGNLLEQTLTREQYAASVRVRPESAEMVDFAVRLPGRQQDAAPVWLPIDSKFPHEDYERLLEAQERADVDAVRAAGSQLERAVRIQAKSICDKYIAPPHTTDFAVMFLPTEGLYAEVIRRPGLVDLLQRDHRVVVAGPTTFSALLNSLQMGFRTLAIEQRSSEVWQVLGAVKTEFGKFATVLERATTQLGTVQNSIKSAGVRTRAIERKLRGVESLGQDRSEALLDISLEEAEGADEDVQE
jgi:DNA recombination protein RmuC